jgi:hypothetical protein
MTYLRFDLFGRVREIDGCGRVGATHLGLCALESRDEGAVDERGLLEPQARGHISRHAEIRILKAMMEPFIRV